jgi:hypothetical protein
VFVRTIVSLVFDNDTARAIVANAVSRVRPSLSLQLAQLST